MIVVWDVLITLLNITVQCFWLQFKDFTTVMWSFTIYDLRFTIYVLSWIKVRYVKFTVSVVLFKTYDFDNKVLHYGQLNTAVNFLFSLIVMTQIFFEYLTLN